MAETVLKSLRDKLFNFVDYQGIRFSQPRKTVNTIPSQALIQQMLEGDFSGLGTQIYNLYSTTTKNGMITRVPFANNQIPNRDVRSRVVEGVDVGS